MSLLKAVTTISFLTFLSRILGFVRDFVMANIFGASAAMDAFIVAFKLPNLLRRLFAEGAFTQAFIPLFSQKRSTGSTSDQQIFLNQIFTALLVTLSTVTLIGILASPWLIKIFAHGFSNKPEQFELAVQLTRICFPYIFFISFVSLSAGILNTCEKFEIPAFTPVLLNLSMISMSLLTLAFTFFSPPITAVAWGVFVAGGLQLALQVFPLKKIGFLPKLDFSIKKNKDISLFFKLYLPAALGVSIAQISLLINTLFASFLAIGSISWLYFADRLMEFPIGLLGVTLGTILMPKLSKMHASHQTQNFTDLLNWAIQLVFLLATPAAIGLALLRVPIVSTLFQHGEFSTIDTLKTSDAVLAYSFSVIPLVLNKIFAPSFYARQDIRTPVKIGVLTLLLTQILNFALIDYLQHVGLALSITIAAWFNVLVLFFILRKQRVLKTTGNWLSFAFKLISSLLVFSLSLCLLKGADQAWLTMPFIEKTTRLTFIIFSAASIYFLCLYLLGFRVENFKKFQSN